MAIRIVFNGQQYDGVEAMPEDVRRAYQRATGILADRNGNGTPDLLEQRPNTTVVTVEHSTSFRWGGPTPAQPAAPLTGSALHLEPSAPRTLDVLEPATRVLGTLAMVLIAVSVAAVLVFGALMMMDMDAGSRSQGGLFYVGVGMLLALGWLIDMYLKFRNRRS